MKLHEWFNNEALNIWRSHPPRHRLAPLLLPELESNVDLLMVGMNPSFREDWIAKKITFHPEIFDGETPESLLIWDDEIHESRIQKIISLEKIARDEDEIYFKPLENFAKLCGAKNWTHTDTFLIRQTSQKEMLETVYDGRELSAYSYAQVDLLKQLIVKAKPKKVAILNATASNIFQKHIANDSGKKSFLHFAECPIFLGGMLSGQRCMDRYSQLRLIEEIREAKTNH